MTEINDGGGGYQGADHDFKPTSISGCLGRFVATQIYNNWTSLQVAGNALEKVTWLLQGGNWQQVSEGFRLCQALTQLTGSQVAASINFMLTYSLELPCLCLPGIVKCCQYPPAQAGRRASSFSEKRKENETQMNMKREKQLCIPRRILFTSAETLL